MGDNKPTKSSSGRYKLQYRGIECINCGHPLDMSDKYCPNCSQANSTKKLTLKDFFDEFFSSLISYDSKLLKTLSALLLRPGKITLDYVHGKRVSYTNPFRFLLSLSIVYFLIINFTGNFSKWDKFGAETDSEIPDELEQLNGIDFTYNNNGEKNDLKKDLDSLQLTGDWDKMLSKLRTRDSIILAEPTKHFNAVRDSSFMTRLGHKYEFFNTVIQKDSVRFFEDAIEKFQLEPSYENKMAFNAASGYRKFRRQPGSFLSTLISKLPFAIFFFLPAFALFIWLVYIRKKYNYTDHLIFSFHNTTLLIILLIISYLIDSIFDISTNWIFLMVFLIYLFIAMRKFYKQGVFKTTLKYVFLNMIFFILAMFSTLILVMGNMFTF